MMLSANKKINIYLAEGDRVGRILTGGVNTSSRPRLRASKKAEKSGLRRARGSRGLRKNKSRARGRHPRSSLVRQPLPRREKAGPKSRDIRSVLRLHAHHRQIQTGFSNHVRNLYEKNLFIPPSGLRQGRYGPLDSGVGWLKTQRRWRALHSHLVRKTNKHLADTAVGHTYSSFVEDLVGIRLTAAPPGGNNETSFSSLLDGLRKSLPTREESDLPLSVESSGKLCTGFACTRCGQVGRKSLGIYKPCPGKLISIAKSKPGDLPPSRRRTKRGGTRGLNADNRTS